MKQLYSILIILIIANIVSAQSSNFVQLKVQKQSTKKIDIEIKNVSKDIIIIEDFNTCLKNHRYIVSNYTISIDTLTLNWSSSKNNLQSSHSISYQVDGEKKYAVFKLNPNDKLSISIKLFKNDFDKIKMVKIKLNSNDTMVVKL